MNAVRVLPKARRRNSAAILRWFSWLLLCVGTLALGYAIYFYVSAYAFQEIGSISLRHPLPPGAPAIHRVVREGDIIGRIEIGRLGLSAVIAQGDSRSLLRRAVGHLPDTAMPGEPGNVVLAGHRDTFFRSLKDIRTGDTIELETPEGEYKYVVQSAQVVSPTATEVLNSDGSPELTLITCYPFYFLGPAPDRFVVRAIRWHE